MDQLDLFKNISKRRRQPRPREWKLVAVRECPGPEYMSVINTPGQAEAYWRANIATSPHFNPEVECLAVILLNTRLRAKGHHIVSIGSLNEAPAHPREIFRVAVASAAYGIVIMHNHPSGETDPSEADKRLTKRVREAGEILQIQVRDHVIIGHQRYFSFCEMGML
jgi:DNA repair protein RadC